MPQTIVQRMGVEMDRFQRERAQEMGCALILFGCIDGCRVLLKAQAWWHALERMAQ